MMQKQLNRKEFFSLYPQSLKKQKKQQFFEKAKESARRSGKTKVSA